MFLTNIPCFEISTISSIDIGKEKLFGQFIVLCKNEKILFIKTLSLKFSLLDFCILYFFMKSNQKKNQIKNKSDFTWSVIKNFFFDHYFFRGQTCGSLFFPGGCLQSATSNQILVIVRIALKKKNCT